MKPFKLTSVEMLRKVIIHRMFVQTKWDGFRCVILDGKAHSFSMKPIRNAYTKKILEDSSKIWGSFLDGELLLNDPNATFQDIQSAFMSYEGAPDFKYVIYDGINYRMRFAERLDVLRKFIMPPRFELTETLVAGSVDEILAYEEIKIAAGHEGIIIRHPDGRYKHGRATLKEGTLFALKRYEDGEAKIIGFEAMESNQNEIMINAHGLTERSSSQVGKIKLDTLGKFLVEGINGVYKGKRFSIGTGEGLTLKLRKQYWDRRQNMLGDIVTYKYFKVGSTSEAPRQPIMKGIRHKEDM